MFDPVNPKQSFPDLDHGILKYWQEEDIFKRTLKQRKGGEVFSFYDGPPFATGLPHYGHLLAGTIKDVIPRYQSMRGRYVERRFGWDCHGLPVENIVEQEHDIQDHKQIEEMGVGKFNELCREAVQRFTAEWRKVVERMGRWVDMDWDYRTMDPDYMESIWWVFNQLYKKELIYEGKKAMHICPRCVTPLSNFEVTQGYKDVDDMAVTWKFKLKDAENTFVLAWTTTSWSTLSTMGLSIKPEGTYVKIKVGDEFIIIVKDRIDDVMKGTEDYEVVDEFSGSSLVGKEYEHIAPWYGDIPEVKANDRAFHIYAGDYVETSEGTGIVTINGSYGEIDMEAAKQNGLPTVLDVDMTGHFTEHAGPYAGMFVKDGEKQLVTDMKEKGLVWRKDMFRHSYPHCWRCDSLLLNYGTNSWFVAVERIKNDLLQQNAKTSWVPAHIRDGRFGKWLEGARDWAISRNRYWGTPLPIWRCEETGDLEVIGSREDLMKRQKIRFTKVTALRHAESEGNLVPIYQGELPGTDLTRNGKKQALTVGKELKDDEVTVVYCSPLARAKQTAEIVAKACGAKVIVDDRLREVHFGDYEGKTVDFSDLTFVKERRAHKIESGRPESIYHLQGMESWESVDERMKNFLEETLPKHRSEHIAIVTHADPINNIRHFFTKEDPLKLSHQPYPERAAPYTYYWDHQTGSQLDLHKQTVDHISWPGSPCDQSVDITLVRHGETDQNKNMKCQGGDVDFPLNETGKEQARHLANSFKGQKFDIIVSSHLQRAIQTAEILAETLGIPYKERLEDLREREVGEWNGKTFDEAVGSYPKRDPQPNPASHFGTPEGGESLSEFMQRMNSVAEVLRDKYAGKKILVACHRGTIQGLRTAIDNLSYDGMINARTDNAETINLRIDPHLRRIPEVLDCWFESGSMPYAQSHYPFEMSRVYQEMEKQRLLDFGFGIFGKIQNSKSKKLPPGFPANFIAEGIDQTRGWFYTLMVLSTALFNKPAFYNCVVNGIVLAEDGKKMSKRLKNYPEPMEVVEKYGADAIRFTLMNSPAVRGEDLRFSEKLVEDSMRNVLLPLWNTYSFFVTYANAAKYEPAMGRHASNHPLDLWILAEVQDLVNRMTEQLDGYDLSATTSELFETIDALTNWYVRLSRRRFAGKNCDEEEQEDALQTLYQVLMTLSQVLAPFCPYITDAIYLNLIDDDHESVHLTDWPKTRVLEPQEKKLLEKTRLLRLIVSLGLKVRSEQKIKTRQPLAKATIAMPQTIELTDEDRMLIQQELNVKTLEFAADPEQLARAIAQVDARKVGPRLGKKVQEIINAGKDGQFEVRDNGYIRIKDEDLSPDEAVIVYRGKEGEDVAADRGVVVSVETALSEDLEREGLARDLIRFVQQQRKDSGLSFTDMITLSIEGADDILKEHGKLIEQETRAILSENQGEEHVTELDGRDVKIKFMKQ